MLRSSQTSTQGLLSYHYHGKIIRLQFGGLQNTPWNQLVVDIWRPQGVFLILPIYKRIRKIIVDQV